MRLRKTIFFLFVTLAVSPMTARSDEAGARNPVIWADVPDVSVIRAGDRYYMSSTTMHMNPGLPIMRSPDLVNWTLVRYAYDTLVHNDSMNLVNGEDAYGAGSWASSLRYHEGRYYVSTFSSTSGRTHVYWTDDIEDGEWQSSSFEPMLHDHSLFFEDGRVYMVWGAGEIRMVELEPDFSGIRAGTEPRVIIADASAPIDGEIMLKAEGSQLYRVDGRYYLFNIAWPRGGMRTVLVHRADSLDGPWEGRIALQDAGIAQGGLVDTPDGRWYAMLFGDRGAVGRIPYLVPVTWEDGWPVLGEDGQVPDTLDIAVANTNVAGIVTSDEFDGPGLPLAWQWNHNPLPAYWSLDARPGFLRLTTDRVDNGFLDTRNTLTQRTYGPVSDATVSLDVSGMRDGDVAGLGLLQRHYGYVAVRQEDGQRFMVMVNAGGDAPLEQARVPLDGDVVHFAARADFRDLADTTSFEFSTDGTTWTSIGEPLMMRYTLPHFMGYRFALFNAATREAGGYVDFDHYRVEPPPAWDAPPPLP
ncbi:glycosyl hydrolase 43 family protein [Marinihelvus fidelis]|uniref:Glycosyl hydrolase 43 family protein n=1 Tax=Marinihelvus fidelis TaxID=2613842 RepID=A0A5N0TIX4_9GAMM|nr:glycoside hydrolase 43 family protein [Marinihelvus fidelis]KAA9134047.1 glycosyl hydrolase 43 family protein [Marinihelvus fidelis]